MNNEPKFLAAFICPFCKNRAVVLMFKQSDGWTEVYGSCDDDKAPACGISFNFGSFGSGCSLEQMKNAVIETVGDRFVN